VGNKINTMRQKLTLKMLTDLKLALSVNFLCNYSINFIFGINLIFCINYEDNFSEN